MRTPGRKGVRSFGARERIVQPPVRGVQRAQSHVCEPVALIELQDLAILHESLRIPTRRLKAGRQTQPKPEVERIFFHETLKLRHRLQRTARRQEVEKAI